MTGERDLRKLLRHMTPQLQPGTFVFSTFPDNDLPADLAPIATFREAEGLSAILALDEARRAGVPYQFESGLITLTIHSSLDAAEFLAAVSAVLADAGILCKAVSACHHVHFFMPRERAQRPLISARGGCSAGVDSWSGKGTVKLKAPRVHRRGEQQHQPEKRLPQKSVPCPLQVFDPPSRIPASQRKRPSNQGLQTRQPAANGFSLKQRDRRSVKSASGPSMDLPWDPASCPPLSIDEPPSPPLRVRAANKCSLAKISNGRNAPLAVTLRSRSSGSTK
ncbi:ACT domain-containing protein [Azohydromonas australica]|uniref:ACT domain-containing protein n=1 Tax=Azohydromonas australica TaxID=364039 RepID=UPI0009FDA35A|nr:ACT domain-containing protein [Azohydromonas australica]